MTSSLCFDTLMANFDGLHFATCLSWAVEMLWLFLVWKSLTHWITLLPVGSLSLFSYIASGNICVIYDNNSPYCEFEKCCIP